jgi:rubredoxin
MVGRISEGSAALTAERSERHIQIERAEEAFDRVDLTCLCPNCGALVEGFRTKDLCNQLDKVDYRIAYHLYAECRCGTWIDFIRKPATSIEDFDMHVETN